MHSALIVVFYTKCWLAIDIKVWNGQQRRYGMLDLETPMVLLFLYLGTGELFCKTTSWGPQKTELCCWARTLLRFFATSREAIHQQLHFFTLNVQSSFFSMHTNKIWDQLYACLRDNNWKLSYAHCISFWKTVNSVAWLLISNISSNGGRLAFINIT